MSNSYNEPRIRFYGLEEEKIDLKKIVVKSDINKEETVKVSHGLSTAIHDLTKKDILFLSNKLKKLVNEINNRIEKNGIENGELSYNIEDIDNIIKSLNIIKKEVIKKKGKIKIGLFSSKKKEKKKNITSLEEFLDYLPRCKNDLIAVKNEYNSIKKRSFNMDLLDFGEDVKDECDDPIERTVNFYLNNKKEN